MFQPTCRFQCHFMWRVPLELTWLKGASAGRVVRSESDAARARRRAARAERARRQAQAEATRNAKVTEVMFLSIGF